MSKAACAGGMLYCSSCCCTSLLEAPVSWVDILVTYSALWRSFKWFSALAMANTLGNRVGGLAEALRGRSSPWSTEVTRSDAATQQLPESAPAQTLFAPHFSRLAAQAHPSSVLVCEDVG